MISTPPVFKHLMHATAQKLDSYEIQTFIQQASAINQQKVSSVLPSVPSLNCLRHERVGASGLRRPRRRTASKEMGGSKCPMTRGYSLLNKPFPHIVHTT